MNQERSFWKLPHVIFTFEGDFDYDLARLEQRIPGVLVYGQTRHGGGRWRLKGSSLRPGDGQEYRLVAPLNAGYLVEDWLEAEGVVYAQATRGPMINPWSDREAATWEKVGTKAAKNLEGAGLLKTGVAALLTGFQRTTVGFLQDRPAIECVWPCGSGKTLGALVAALSVGRRILIIGPGKSRATWEREVGKRSNVACYRHYPESQRTKKDPTLAEFEEAISPRDPRVYIYGAEGLPGNLDDVIRIDPDVLIVDELQLFGSRERWEATEEDDGDVTFTLKKSKKRGTVKLGAAGMVASRLPGIKKVIGLTATPLDDGRPRRLWSQLDILWPGGFGMGYWDFASRYCDAKRGAYGMDDKGSGNLIELRDRASWMIHEVSRDESHAGLPETRVEVEYLARSEQCRADRYSDEETYGQAQRRLAKQASRGTVPKSSVVEARLAEACSKKRRYLVGEIEQALRGKGKVVVFVTRIREVAKLAEALKRRLTKGDTQLRATVLEAHGGVPARQRDEMVEKYRKHAGPICLIATTDSMGTSVDGLQNTDVAFLAMLPYRPGDYTQQRGRFDRRDADRPTLIRVIVAKGTVDEHVVGILTDKIGPIEAMFDERTLADDRDRLLGIDDASGLLDEIIGKLAV